MFCLLIVLAGATHCLAGVDNQAMAMVNAANIRGTKVSLFAMDLDSGQPMLSINGDEPMIPASNMKLLTTAAALGSLGPDFIFKTELRLIEEPPAPPAANTPTTNGKAVTQPAPGVTLLVHGDGDPSLGDQELLALKNVDIEDLLQTWVAAVKAAKVTHVKRLLVDDRVFDQQMVHPNWPEAQLNNWYCAEVAGLNFNDNCFDLYPEPTRPGQSPLIRIRPAAPFLTTFNKAVTDTAVDNFSAVRRKDTNELTFWGKVRSRRTTPASVTLHDPPIFFVQVLSNRLIESGVAVESCGRLGQDDQIPQGRVLHVLQTELPAVLARCNKDSQNLFAECLIKRLGFAKTGAPGSWENGAAAVRLFLANSLGPAASVASISDGSGMSKENRVTAHLICELLGAMHRTPRLGPIYRASLSEAGHDGTLQKRLTSKDIQGKVYGKTGQVNGVVTMSGYLVIGQPPANPNAPQPVANSGQVRTVAFSFLFNNIPSNVQTEQIKSLQDKLVKLLEREIVPENMDNIRLGG